MLRKGFLKAFHTRKARNLNRECFMSTRALSIESLERRNLMAILWVNQGSATNNSDGFNTWFPDTYATARAIARRAVDDWNAVIQSFNYAEDSDGNPANNLHDTFNLTISALDLGNSNRGQVQFSTFSYNVDNAPTAATVELDNNAAGTGWFFDATPSDDAEFTGIAGIFQGSFVDASAAG